MTITIPSGRTLPLKAKAGGGFESTGVPAFVPMIAENFSTGTLGSQVSTNGSNWNARSTYDQTRAFSGTQSMKVAMSSSDGQSCAGSHFYGGKITLPAEVPKGKNIWLRFKMYIPSTFSWGYVYGGGDTAAADACGQQDDGFGRAKFIVFDTTENLRMYLQLHSSRRDVSRQTGLTIDSDVGAFGGLDSNYLIPVDQWVDLQIHLFVDDVNGFYRVWSNGTYKGQVNDPTIGSATARINKVGIGDYWNGVHYTDGQAGRSDFWVDEMIVASDVDGYGAPDSVDASGNPYIDPDTLTGDL